MAEKWAGRHLVSRACGASRAAAFYSSQEIQLARRQGQTLQYCCAQQEGCSRDGCWRCEQLPDENWGQWLARMNHWKQHPGWEPTLALSLFFTFFCSGHIHCCGPLSPMLGDSRPPFSPYFQAWSRRGMWSARPVSDSWWPHDCIPQASVHGNVQTKVTGGCCFLLQGSSPPRIAPVSPASPAVQWILYHWATGFQTHRCL